MLLMRSKGRRGGQREVAFEKKDKQESRVEHVKSSHSERQAREEQSKYTVSKKTWKVESLMGDREQWGATTETIS